MRIIALFTFITLNIFQPACNKKNLQKTKDISFLDTAPNLFADKVADSLKYLIPILDTVLRTDQRYRTEALYMANLNEQNRLDSINTETVTGILDRYGWLGMKDIGYLGYMAINMVMAHSSLQCKLKYQPMMLQATLNKKMIPADYALFEDKLNLQRKGFQYYGTQLFEYNNRKWPYPIYQPDSIDARRARLKMNTMSQYLNDFKIKWDIQEYKTILPELVQFRKASEVNTVHDDLSTVLKSN